MNNTKYEVPHKVIFSNLMFFVLFFSVSEANARYSFYRHEGGH